MSGATRSSDGDEIDGPAVDPGPLVVKNIHVSAGAVKILQAIQLCLLPGELCALIGPSGAGKSTLIKVLLGLRQPDRGNVTLGGRALGDVGPVGYVPQHDALHVTLSLRRELDYAAQLRLPGVPAAERARRVDAVAAQLGLDERLDVRIKRLSGGQKKRVSVALELLTRPPVLILDEPTSGLDPGLEARLMSLFMDVARSGRVVLVATHAMQSLSKADTLIVLQGGHLAYFGYPAGALEFFRTDGYAGIFDQLPKMASVAWERAYRRSPFYREWGQLDRAPLPRGPNGGGTP